MKAGVHFHLGVHYRIVGTMPAEVLLRRPSQPVDGLRSRKKAKTRHAIEDAALALFAQHGFEATTVDQIAERAEVSTTTFFRYFPSKADVVLESWGEGLPSLHDAIVERPPSEPDLLAAQRAIETQWVAAIDPDRTIRLTRAVETSALLRGLSYQVGERWLAAVSDALARRRGLSHPDQRCTLAARVVLEVWADAVAAWVAGGGRDDLGTAVADAFAAMDDLARDWSESERA
jgi:AcrR family transcriptional regulator